MFYYLLLHVPLIHLIAVIVCYARFGQAHWMFRSLGDAWRLSHHRSRRVGDTRCRLFI